ncbi:MAG TPA: glycoside hydrolase family 3 protein [Clostridiales bacterium]|nr:glycoside hydrolase family 3 protein [Clostridiales bacterium]
MSSRISKQEAEKRARELVEQMTIEERASQLRYDAPAIERLNIPAYNWWNEALHGVARAGTATMFPQAIGLAAMFDPDFLKEIADIIATEGRAKYNEFIKHDDRDIFKGLTFWSPNINIFRDPRWGRGHETYGEDPYLTGRLGVAFIKGLQGNGKYLKAAACAKHYAVHSGPEKLRHEFNAEVSSKDLWETYLPAFEDCVVEAKVESVMGAYNRTNGEPCCGSYTLLKDILREKWKFEGHVVSDCWAIRDFHTKHLVTSTAPESAALALKAGCDLNCGNTYLHILQALKDGLITEEDITRAAVRLFTTRIKLGMFDECEYDNIPYSVVDSKEHNEAALEAARKSLVLLKNDGILPLNKGNINSIGVIGPNANNRIALRGNYYGTPSRYITILEGIQDYVEGENIRIYYAEGCQLVEERTSILTKKHDRLSEALTVAEHSDVVILCLGLDETLEGEEKHTSNHSDAGDKIDLNLPAVQQYLLEKVASTGKPIILLLSTGSAVNLDFADKNCRAIIQTWYPGARGGKAVAECLFGEFSPSGKLPVTFYSGSYELPDFTDYSMKGRTYRYIETEPLYPFGYGLTYSKVALKNLKLLNKVTRESDILLSVEIENAGAYDTEEVVQIYIKDNKSKFAVPNHSLCGFKRVFLKKGETKTLKFTVLNKAMNIVDDEGNRYIDSDSFTIFAGISQPDKRSEELTGVKALSAEIKL